MEFSAREQHTGFMLYSTIDGFIKGRIASNKFTISDGDKVFDIHPIINVEFDIPQIGRFSNFVVTELENYTMVHNDTMIFKFFFNLKEEERKYLKSIGYSDTAIELAVKDLKDDFIDGCIKGINSSVTKILKIAPAIYVIDTIITPFILVFNSIKSLLTNLWKKL